jgi:DNA repair protein RadC
MKAAASGSTRVLGVVFNSSPECFLEEERKDMTIQRSFLDEVRGSAAKTNRWNLTHQNGGPLLQSIPLRERPVYRVSYQVKDCNVLELLAALVGGKDQMEVAAALLSRFESLQSLSRATIHELTSVYGIGLARAACVKAALELGQRRMISQEDHAPTIQSPDDAAALLLPLMQDLEQEHLYVLILDTRNRIIGEPLEIYHGSLNSSLVRVAEIFRPAIQANAAAILAAHNHPSGDPTPSPEDVAITRAVVQAGKLLDVACIDHIIIGRGRFVSLKSRGLGFN